MGRETIPLVIKPLKKQDIEEVMEIERASFSDPWRENMFYNEIHNRKISRFLVARADEKLVGYGGIWIIQDEAHIVNLAVDPDYRKQGIGTKLLRSLFEEARKKVVERATLEVRASNTIAQQFYKRFGFVEIAVRKSYYQDTHEDAIIMWLDGMKIGQANEGC